MARTPITITDIPFSSGLSSAAVVWTAADSVNNHSMNNDGQTLLLVRNSDTAAHTAVIASVADDGGRVGDNTLTAAAAAAGVSGICISNLIPIKGFNQTDGTVTVNVATATGMALAGVRITPRR